MMAEIAVGRYGRQSAVRSIVRIAREEGGSKHWRFFPWLGISMNLLALTFYAVVACWSLAYMFKIGAILGAEDVGAATKSTFDNLLGNPWELMFWYSLLMFFTTFIVAKGIRKGIERAARWMLPALFLMLVIQVIFAMIWGDFGRAVAYLFTPEFSKINSKVVLIALGQAFFSVGVGGVGTATFAAYLPKKISIPKYALATVGADVIVSLLAGLAIFPFVFKFGLPVGSGQGLIFTTMPIAFSQVPGGLYLGFSFFLLLTFAALSSTIAVLEPFVSWGEENKGWKRPWISFAVGGGTWFVGIAAVLSYNVWQDVTPLDMFSLFEGKTFSGIAEYLVTTITYPIGVLLWAIFAGWMMARKSTVEALNIGDGIGYTIWRFLLRYLVPISIIWLFIDSLRS